MSDTPSTPTPAPPGPPAPKTDVVHDVAVPVAQAAIGGIVSAAVTHVAGKAAAPTPAPTGDAAPAPDPKPE